MLVAFNSFVRRQTKESPHSHFGGTDEELIKQVEDNWDKRKKSYRKNEDGNEVEREGVFLIPISPVGWYTGVVVLKDGDKLVGEFSPRIPGEKPRKHVYKHNPEGLPKAEAKFVDIVLYAHDILAEDDDAETDAEYEIVSLNAYLIEAHSGGQPIHPDTLNANHFGLPGGTKTNMTDQEYADLMRISVPYWADKVPLDMG